MAKVRFTSKLKCVALYIFAAISVQVIFVFVLLPALVYRFIVNKLVHWNDCQLGPILSGQDAMYCRPEWATFLFAIFPLNQTVNRERFINVMETQLIAPNYYPNLKQRVVKKFGYAFWKNVDNFSLEYHVVHFNPSNPDQPVTTKQFKTWFSENKNKGFTFDSSRSPWEFILIENYVDFKDPSVKSLVVLKVNHLLMDGLSMLKFLQKLSLKPWKLNAQASNCKKDSTSILHKLKTFLLLTVTMPHYLAKSVIDRKDKNLQLCKALSSSNYQYKVVEYLDGTQAIPLVRLKKVKNFYGVSMATLVNTLASTAVAHQFKRKFGGMPKTMKVSIVLPWPGHPDALTNHATMTPIFVRVFEDNPVQTLMELDKKYRKALKTPGPLTNFYTTSTAGLLPLWFKVQRNILPTHSLVLSNMPGPGPEKVDLCGFEYKNLYAKASSDLFIGGFGFVTNSMGSNFYMDAHGMDAFLQEEDSSAKFTNSLHKTLNLLEKRVTTEKKYA